MTGRELEKFKKLLLKKREEIVGELKHITKDVTMKSQREASGDLSGYVYHMADAATDSYDREFSLNIASTEREMLFEIDEALKRIKEKVYGGCERCGKRIDTKRLIAIPYAKFCVECQSKIEKEIDSGLTT